MAKERFDTRLLRHLKEKGKSDIMPFVKKELERMGDTLENRTELVRQSRALTNDKYIQCHSCLHGEGLGQLTIHKGYESNLEPFKLQVIADILPLGTAFLKQIEKEKWIKRVLTAIALAILAGLIKFGIDYLSTNNINNSRNENRPSNSSYKPTNESVLPIRQDTTK